MFGLFGLGNRCCCNCREPFFGRSVFNGCDGHCDRGGRFDRGARFERCDCDCGFHGDRCDCDRFDRFDCDHCDKCDRDCDHCF
ncbi:MAG: hypothetical protein FWF10_10820 [Clostridiales bacterium]|nr:hypothetical protein [Clostridiales bacterium]